MKNILALLCFLSFNVAAATNVGQDSVTTNQAGIVVPSVATGFMLTSKFANDVNGDIVICKIELTRDRKCGDSNNQWVRIQDAIPKGKQYVGFRSIFSPRYDTPYLEIYWK